MLQEMDDVQLGRVVHAKDIRDALFALSTFGDDAALLAGGSWVMRAPIRREPMARILVSLIGIEELHEIHLSEDVLSIGALATHVTLAKAIKNHPALKGLWIAASWCANPAIRSVATVGGNICSTGFFSPDIVPSLMSLGASIEIANQEGREQLPLADYIKTRVNRAHEELVCRLLVPITDGVCSHVRLTVRKAGDYPIANLSVAIVVDQNRTIMSARIAVGSVQKTIVRWLKLEAALIGEHLDDIEIKSLAADLTNAFTPRDGADAPGWYRLRVLPKLAEQAFDDLLLQLERGS